VDDDRLLAHAVVRAAPEQSAARELKVKLGEPLPKRPLVNAWRAEREGRELALVLLEGRVSDDEKHRFLDAASRMHALSPTQPGLLKVHAVLEKPSAFLADLAPGGTLESLPTQGWPAPRRLDIVKRVGTAMAELHEAGVVHGSLCPANVLLDKDSLPVLAEVGMVSLRESFEGDAEGVFGYGDYAAPEVKTGGEPDVKSDVYSLGRLLLFATIEASPTEDEGLARATRAQRGWVDVIRCATDPSPEKRYATAREFLLALDPLFDRVSVVEPEPTPPVPRAAAEARPAAPAPPKAAAELAFAAPRAAAPAGPRLKTALVGALLVVATLAVAFLVNIEGVGPRTALTLAVALGGALASLGLRPLPRWPVASRWMLAAGVAAVACTYDPAGFVARIGAMRRLGGGDLATRRAAVVELLARQRDLRHAALADVDLSRLDMRGADLRGADMSRADLAQSNLWGALLDGTVLGGAHLQGAELSGTSLAGSAGVSSADCDEATRFPGGWRCVDGHPAVEASE
jgi:Protein tyrosine and serine/threonine kinase/Pentapeptide repeats (8 copies)